MDTKIIVSTHKDYRMPKDKTLYLPVHAGYDEVSEHFGFQGDNTGDNISYKHRFYSEVSTIYWGWKNLSCDYIGLCHYRRYFTKCKKSSDKWDNILNKTEVGELLKKTDVILPKKRNYFIESTYNQYAHAHNRIDLDTVRVILEEKYPTYVDAFDICMKRTYGHRFNMFIMKKDIFDDYCAWMFDVIFELEKRLDISSYSENDSRVFGFVAERILDVWIELNNISYKELKVLFMEKQNWLVKGTNFILRKFGIKKK